MRFYSGPACYLPSCFLTMPPSVTSCLQFLLPCYFHTVAGCILKLPIKINPSFLPEATIKGVCRTATKVTMTCRKHKGLQGKNGSTGISCGAQEATGKTITWCTEPVGLLVYKPTCVCRDAGEHIPDNWSAD